MSKYRLNRRSFLSHALSGGVAAGTAYLGLTRDLYARDGGPIILGNHCELTGGFASWGYWHDKAAKAAVALVNEQGGIAGRKVELVTEDTEPWTIYVGVPARPVKTRPRAKMLEYARRLGY